jgi:hypothetical protein
MHRRRVLLEAWVEPKLRRVMREAGRDAALEHSRGGMGRVVAISIPEYRDAIRGVLYELYERTTKDVGAIVVDSAKSAFPLREFKEIDVTLETLLEQFAAFALDEAVLIADTMKEEIALAIEPLVAEGAGERAIGRAIRKRVDGLAPWQANRIARTETLMASSFAQEEVVRDMPDMPPLAKEWDSSRDARTRKAHRGVRPVLVDDYFSVGGKRMKYTGDRAGGPENVINCRCTVNYTPADQMPELEAEVEERLADIREDEEFREANL